MRPVRPEVGMKFYEPHSNVPMVGKPGDEFGRLGSPLLVEKRLTAGSPPEILLLRRLEWPQGDNPAGINTSKVTLELRQLRTGEGHRPLIRKEYVEEVANGRKVPSQLYEQNVTGLAGFWHTALKAMQEGNAPRLCRMFANASRALKALNDAAGSDRVPLQLPEGLAVLHAEQDRVVPLEAELFPVGPLPPGGPANKLYSYWFDLGGASGTALAADADRLHAAALVKYFKHICSKAPGDLPEETRRRLRSLVDGMARDSPLSDLHKVETWFDRQAVESMKPLPDLQKDRKPPDEVAPGPSKGATPVPTPTPARAAPAPAPAPGRGPRRWPWVALSLVSLTAACVFGGLWWRLSGEARQLQLTVADLNGQINQTGNPGGREIPGMGYPVVGVAASGAGQVHFVVFPSPRTPPHEVAHALAEKFTEKDQKIRELIGQAGREKLKAEQMRECLDAISKEDEAKVEALLTGLLKKDVRFVGFESAKVPGVIGNAGVFTIRKGTRQESNGCLLQPDAVERVCKGAELAADDEKEARRLLDKLRRGVADYAALGDAVTINSNRNAILVTVPAEPGQVENARRYLGSTFARSPQLALAARPGFLVYEAIDPETAGGGAATAFKLKPKYDCRWRQVGSADRAQASLAGLAGLNRARWSEIKANTEINWETVQLERNNGDPIPLPTSTFDIAVEIDGKVVVFRNQFVWKNADPVRMTEQMSLYLQTRLGLKGVSNEEALDVNNGQGTFSYNSLANRAVNGDVAGSADLEIYTSVDEFKKKTAEEDKQLPPPAGK